MINNLVPHTIDGAKVLKWAWAGESPFGFINFTDTNQLQEVFGLAICQYENESGFYRFSCDKNWETLQDGFYDSIEEAIEYLPNQYKSITLVWHTK